MARSLLAAGVLAAAAALIAGCGRIEGSSTPRKVESVMVASAPGLISASIVMAGKGRFFAEQGLEVTIKPTSSDRTTIDTVVQGQADVGLSASVPFVIAVIENKDIHLLARVFRSRNYVSIVARRDRGITRPADLSGKRIGFVPGASPDYFIDVYLGIQGIRPSQYTRVALAMDQVESALQDGGVDAVATWHPYNSRLVARLGPQAMEFSDPAIFQIRVNLVARAEFAKLRPDTARRFLLALQNALTYMRDNPAEAKRLVVDAGMEDPAHLDRVWREADFSMTLDQSLLGILEDEARWSLAKRGMAQAMLPHFLDFIDAQPLRSARPEAVSLLLP